MLFGDKIGGGGNSGFQALNLVVRWGARRVILVGFDMNPDASEHWYGRNKWPLANNPNEMAFKRWRNAFGTAAAQCRQMGVEVVNCSPFTAMKHFPVMSLEDALCSDLSCSASA